MSFNIIKMCGKNIYDFGIWKISEFFLQLLLQLALSSSVICVRN